MMKFHCENGPCSADFTFFSLTDHVYRDVTFVWRLSEKFRLWEKKRHCESHQANEAASGSVNCHTHTHT